ncbi:membrane metallo-endopeptidase-like 1, partial [Orussus abietinus]|uniref:membrane metallo-endopeptidase-like 1 n=1 Tax=Orussus abietinus TaxID=222816 RepID=UPI000C715D8E
IGSILMNNKNELELQINNSAWLDQSGKLASIYKISQLTEFIGHPTWYRNDTAIDEYYNNLTIGTSYFRNGLNKKRFSVKKSLQALTNTINNNLNSIVWKDGIFRMNAQYSQKINAIILPAGVMQLPFFMNDIPEPVQYGALGSMIGHELSHSFDESGRKLAYDSSPMIWSEESVRAFRAKAQCFINQYNKFQYELEPVNFTAYVNGAKTEMENMADNVGLHINYAAFRQETRRKQRNYRRLPGLQYFQNDQLFFLSYANIWCENTMPVYLAYLTKFPSNHCIGKHRTIGSLSNTEAFANAFHCPKGSAMNANDKCSLWA